MKNQTFKLNSVLLAFSAAFVLGACGGGGGGGSDSGSANNGGSNNGGNNGGGPVSTCANGATDYPNCTVLPLQTSVPTPTYLPNSVELQAFTEINAVRQKLGLGLWAQSKALDTAAKNHVNYIVVNLPTDSSAYAHLEKQGNTGFTGAGPGDRAKFAGYPGFAGEVIGGPNAVYKLSPTFDLLNTIGHAQLLFDQCSTDIGIAYLPMIYQGLSLDPTVYNNGSKNNNLGVTLCQKNKDDFWFTYPFDGQVNVPLAMTPEKPNPIPDIVKDQFGGDDWYNGTSAPIIIGFERSKSIDAISATVTEVPSNTVLPMRLLWWQSTTYPNPYKDKYIAFLVGYKPFKSQTKYQVTYNATVSGMSLSRTATFTTK